MQIDLKIGDVVQIKEFGWGFSESDVGKWVEITSVEKSHPLGYGVYAKEYEDKLDTLRVFGFNRGYYVGVASFGKSPSILLNTLDESLDNREFGCDEEFVKVAEGSKEMIDHAFFGMKLNSSNSIGVDEQIKQQSNMVDSPNHYRLFHKDEIEGDFIEVKHVVKRILERWQYQEKISFDMYQAGCYKELLQYLLRAPLKNNIEDVEKAQYYLKEILKEW